MIVFLKPTKITFRIFGSLIGIVAGSFLVLSLDVDLPVVVTNGLTAIYMPVIHLPFKFLKFLKLPVGHFTDYFGYASPNNSGWALIISIDVVIAYIISCIGSTILMKGYKK